MNDDDARVRAWARDNAEIAAWYRDAARESTELRQVYEFLSHTFFEVAMMIMQGAGES
jgi:hypothetical protein